ncbi:hypothetical protein KKG90_11095 [Candidatus Bipolaricaulota bacterium]|nr:hypothetical protein [Candidatus Bipolaricaulota bacterium]
MNGAGYRDFLQHRNISSATIDTAIAVVESFETFLRSRDQNQTADAATADAAKSFSEQLICEGGNSFDSYLALLRYGVFSQNRALYVAMLELLDGAEAFGNLHAKIGNELGEAKRDEYFQNVQVPPLGTPNEKKPVLVQQVIDRLEKDDPGACRQILGSGLRDLKDEWYQDAVTEFAACSGIDAYLAKRSESFIAELEEHKRKGSWWFVQEITEEVIAFVRQHPLMSGGVREGRIVYEVKIPYMAKEWLQESDPKMKRYYACHCPWVRESLRTGDVHVSPTFCHCSAAFHKKPWEIIFGQPLQADVVESILKGDSQCKFAIHLPESAL